MKSVNRKSNFRFSGLGSATLDFDAIYFFPNLAQSSLRKSSKRRYKRQDLEVNTTLYEVQGDPVISLPREYMGFTHVYNRKHYAKMPWYRRIPGVRAMNHKIETYIAKFS